MVTRIYSKGCEWCNATGHVAKFYNPNNEGESSSTALTNICPVCKGSGLIPVTERED